MAQRLIAKAHILYSGRQYRPGEQLPTNNPAYVSAWIAAGSAVWTDEGDGSEETVKKKAAKAQRKTAPAGATGIAQPATGAEEDLVGKVPSRKARGVVKEKSRKAAKSPA